MLTTKTTRQCGWLLLHTSFSLNTWRRGTTAPLDKVYPYRTVSVSDIVVFETAIRIDVLIMDSEHQNLHPKLKNFSIFHSFYNLIITDELAISFLEEVGLIPSKTSPPPTCICGSPMLVELNKIKKLGWIWRCGSKGSKKTQGNADIRLIQQSTLSLMEVVVEYRFGRYLP